MSILNDVMWTFIVLGLESMALIKLNAQVSSHTGTVFAIVKDIQFYIWKHHRNRIYTSSYTWHKKVFVLLLGQFITYLRCSFSGSKCFTTFLFLASVIQMVFVLNLLKYLLKLKYYIQPFEWIKRLKNTLFSIYICEFHIVIPQTYFHN